MIESLLSIGFGVLVVVVITAFTGYFVAQEFGYMAVDRARLKATAVAGDPVAERALAITGRTSFMLSGAQLGITVTGLLVGYVAEPLIGDGVAAAFGGSGAAVAAGTVLALLIATVVQMVFGELFPKNLAIARPEPVARALALSTTAYLAIFGWLITLFDAASNLLLRALRIEPVHDVEHSATPRDLEAIIDESRTSGELDPDLSTLLDKTLDFTDRTARAAMIPRPRVTSIGADETVEHLVDVMASGHSRLPVLGQGADDVVGVICLRDVLALEGQDLSTVKVADVARRAVLVPASLPLPVVLDRLREADDEFACVVDEYGGLAGVITMEDIAEELVGEITDEHDPAGTDRLRGGDGTWTVPGSLSIDDTERLIGAELPAGEYQTIGGLVIDRLQRLPGVDDSVELALSNDGDGGRLLAVTVCSVERRVPGSVRLAVRG
ncbi:hemolysin family protein [Actinomycetes bacterium KLBMP 9759]